MLLSFSPDNSIWLNVYIVIFLNHFFKQTIFLPYLIVLQPNSLSAENISFTFE